MCQLIDIFFFSPLFFVGAFKCARPTEQKYQLLCRIFAMIFLLGIIGGTTAGIVLAVQKSQAPPPPPADPIQQKIREFTDRLSQGDFASVSQIAASLDADKVKNAITSTAQVASIIGKAFASGAVPNESTAQGGASPNDLANDPLLGKLI